MLHRNGGIFPWCICGRMDCELAEDPPPPAEPACVMEPEPGPEPAQVVEPEPEPEPGFVPELELDLVPCSLPGCNRQGHASSQRASYCSSTCHDLDLKAPVARVRGGKLLWSGGASTKTLPPAPACSPEEASGWEVYNAGSKQWEAQQDVVIKFHSFS